MEPHWRVCISAIALAFHKRTPRLPLAIFNPSFSPPATHPAICLLGMMCKDLKRGPTNVCCFSSVVSSGDGCRSEFGGVILCQRKWPMGIIHWSTHAGVLRGNFQGPQTRKMSTSSKSKKRKKKKKKKERARRSLVRKLKQIRYVSNVKKRNMDHEQRLLIRIETAKARIDELRLLLKKYELPPFPMPEHKPEYLTEEERHYLKRLGYKHKNYLIIGVRGVFGGVVQNMHLHWKKHQLVKIRCKNFTKEEIKETGDQLARLSGGTVIDVQQRQTIVMYRGKNYERPESIIPKNTLTKRKALFKARYEQSLESITNNLEALEKELMLCREHKAQEAEGLQSEVVCNESDAKFDVGNVHNSDSEDVEVASANLYHSDSSSEAASSLEIDPFSDSDSDSNVASYEPDSDTD